MATDFFSKGGIQRYSRYQYQALVELYGDENVYVCALSPKQEDNIFEENIDINYIGEGASLTGKIKYAYQVLKLVKQEKIDLLISTHVQLSIIALLAKKLFGVRYMTNVYGLEIWSGLKKRDIIGLLNSDKLIGDCNFILNYIENNFEYSTDNMELLYDPVDTEKFKPYEKSEILFNKYDIPKDKFILSTIGRLERNKGHEIVIRSLKQLSSDIIYVVVGGGKYDQRFKELVKQEGVESRVYFAGRVPEDELVDFYNLADVVVLLSTFGDGEGEGLPLGLIEASACGKPIIAGDQDGSLEAVASNANEVNGFVIDPESEVQFLEIVNKLYQNEDLINVFSENARQYVENTFAFDKFRAKMKKIIG